MVYASIWDWRINHIPLNRAVTFPGAGAELEHATFTRKAGWGMGGAGMSNGGHFGGDRNVVGHGNGVGHGGTVMEGNVDRYGNSVGRKRVAAHTGGHHVRHSDDIV
jgi:diacylglycerol diphosphate phosphatase/phosphatidate phosphatase